MAILKKKGDGGHFYNLFELMKSKLKSLLSPGKGMSFQKHFKRNEIWLVSEGTLFGKPQHSSAENKKELLLKNLIISVVRLGEWHQIINPKQEECQIIEIQYGDRWLKAI